MYNDDKRSDQLLAMTVKFVMIRKKKEMGYQPVMKSQN
jgi:hypothetical protein